MLLVIIYGACIRSYISRPATLCHSQVVTCTIHFLVCLICISYSHRKGFRESCVIFNEIFVRLTSFVLQNLVLDEFHVAFMNLLV